MSANCGLTPRSHMSMEWTPSQATTTGGLTVWRPYERLGPGQQRAMTEAAAAALQLAASGEITPRGPLGRRPGARAAPRRVRGRPGGMERRQAEAELRARCRQQAALARRDPDAARQLLVMFTARCRTYASFYRERRFLVTRLCVPEELLPDHYGPQPDGPALLNGP